MRIAPSLVSSGISALALCSGCFPQPETPDPPAPLEGNVTVAEPRDGEQALAPCGPDREVACSARAAVEEMGVAPGSELLDGAPVEAVERHPSKSESTSEGEEHRAWWTEFGDERLNALVRRAFDSSYRSRAAWARVEAAERLAAAQRARYFPQIDAVASAQASRQVINFPSEFAPPGAGADSGGVSSAFVSETYATTLEGRWQVPLFGRVDSSFDAARLDAEAARDRAVDVQVVLAAEVVRAYFDLLELRERRTILRGQVDAARARFELLRTLFESGLATTLALEQQRQQLASQVTRASNLTGAERQARARLSLLLGTAPRDLELPDADRLPPLPSGPLEVPVNVILQRPDVLAAQKSVRASEERVAAALAERLPTVDLRGSVGLGGTEPDEIFSEIIWTAAASVRQPLWHGGRIGADSERARAEQEEQAARYADKVIEALTEVESALGAHERAVAQRQAIELEVETSRAVVRQAEDEFEHGLVDFVTVLDAERNMFGAQLALLGARRAALEAHVQLQRALGTRRGSSTRRSPPARPRESGRGTTDHGGTR